VHHLSSGLAKTEQILCTNDRVGHQVNLLKTIILNEIAIANTHFIRKKETLCIRVERVTENWPT